MFFFFQETIESLVSREMARRYLQFDIKVRTLETGQSSQKNPWQPYPYFLITDIGKHENPLMMNDTNQLKI